jgi:hypothetical protein
MASFNGFGALPLGNTKREGARKVSVSALEIVLIVAVAALGGTLLLALRTRGHERSRAEAEKDLVRADSLEELAQARAAREHAEAELHEARLRIVALELRREALEADVAEEAGRRGLFRRSSSVIPPEDAERERAGTSRGGV